MKILITGGHLAPALAVIERLKEEKHEIIYAGRKHALEGDEALSLEYQTIPGLGVKFEEINPGRIQRRFTKNSLVALARGPLGYIQALKILKRNKPDVVLGFGGYVQVPFVMASFLLKIPVVIHEQTLEAGLANRISAGLVRYVCLSHQSSEKYFPKKKIILTGNPIRKEILDPSEIIEKPKGLDPLIYITGGSLGAHFINTLVEENLEKLIRHYRIIHQTGDSKQFNDYNRLLKIKEDLGSLSEKYLVYKFLSPGQVGFIMKNSDLIISRGGANTVWEIYVLSKPSIIIPLEYGSKDQKNNAAFLKKAGIAEFYEEKDIDKNSFFKVVNDMIKNIDRYRIKKNKKLFVNSAEKIVAILKNAASTSHYQEEKKKNS